MFEVSQNNIVFHCFENSLAEKMVLRGFICRKLLVGWWRRTMSCFIINTVQRVVVTIQKGQFRFYKTKSVEDHRKKMPTCKHFQLRMTLKDKINKQNNWMWHKEADPCVWKAWEKFKSQKNKWHMNWTKDCKETEKLLWNAFFYRIVTADEKWISIENPIRKKLSVDLGEPSKSTAKLNRQCSMSVWSIVSF